MYVDIGRCMWMYVDVCGCRWMYVDVCRFKVVVSRADFLFTTVSLTM